MLLSYLKLLAICIVVLPLSELLFLKLSIYLLANIFNISHQMSHLSNNLPLGKLLQSAGLISDEQLEQALEFQAQYQQMKLGEILVLQELLPPQTIDFFVNHWQSLVQQGQQYPLGHYLQQACLLDEQQVKIILKEQESNQTKFGVLAVQKGWLKPDTLDFFLKGLSYSTSQVMSLMTLEAYNQKILHLEQKYAEPSLILSRILAWTGGNGILTKSIGHVFATSEFKINPGDEIKTVDRLIESSLIRNWENSQLGVYLRSLRKNWLNNSRCEPTLLLNEYQAILLAGSKPYRQLKQQEELLNLGLVVQDQDNLRVANLIFQQVFTQNWLIKNQELIAASIKTLEPTDSGEIEVVDKSALAQPDYLQSQVATITAAEADLIGSENRQVTTSKSTEPLAKLGALLTLGVIALFAPLFLAINNYYSSIQQNPKLETVSLSETQKLQQFCEQIDLVNPQSYLSLIYQLEKQKQNLLSNISETVEVFPNNCETLFNKLIILAVPQLGKEDRVIEAIKYLCQIPANSDSINEAKVWIERWSNSPSWSQETQSYVSLINQCPAAESN